jgi:hypothetical protein
VWDGLGNRVNGALVGHGIQMTAVGLGGRVDRADLGLIGHGRLAARGNRGPAGGPAVPGFNVAAGN